MSDSIGSAEPLDWQPLENWTALHLPEAVVSLYEAVALSLNRDPFQGLVEASADERFLTRLQLARESAGEGFQLITSTLDGDGDNLLMVRIADFAAWASKTWREVPTEFAGIIDSADDHPAHAEGIPIPADCRDYAAVAAVIPDEGMTRAVRELAGYQIECTGSQELLLAAIGEIATRQQRGEFTVAEAAQILADSQRLNAQEMLRDLLAWRNDLPIRRRELPAPLPPSEPALPLAHVVTMYSVNALLRAWKAPYQFPAYDSITSEIDWPDESNRPPAGYVSLFDLAQEYAAASSKAGADGGDVRNALEAAFAVHGVNTEGGQVPSVVKTVRRMFERGQIRPVYSGNGFAATSAEEISDRGWWLSLDDAQALREELQPIGTGEDVRERHPQNSPAEPLQALPHGIAQDEIAAAFGVHYLGIASLGDALADKRSTWLRANEARMAEGKQGNRGRKALWNPVQVALNLLAHPRWKPNAPTPGHAYREKLGAIDAAFATLASPEWAALWALERERRAAYGCD